MRAFLIAILAAVPLCVAPSVASGQVVVVGPHVVYSPVVPAYPQVVVSVPPVVAHYAPVVEYGTAPAVAYEPVIPPPPPVVVYRPPVVAYRVPVVVGVGPRVVVRPKVYVAGQPVRNIIRAITP